MVTLVEVDLAAAVWAALLLNLEVGAVALVEAGLAAAVWAAQALGAAALEVEPMALVEADLAAAAWEAQALGAAASAAVAEVAALEVATAAAAEAVATAVAAEAAAADHPRGVDRLKYFIKPFNKVFAKIIYHLVSFFSLNHGVMDSGFSVEKQKRKGIPLPDSMLSFMNRLGLKMSTFVSILWDFNTFSSHENWKQIACFCVSSCTALSIRRT